MNAAPPVKTYSLFEILERTFRIYRENFVTCILLIAAVTIPISIINFILSTSSFQKLSGITDYSQLQSTSFDSTTICVSAIITIVLVVVQLVLTNGPISYIASESYFGRKASLQEALQARRERFTTLGWGFLVFYLIGGSFAFAIIAFSSLCAPALALIGAVVFVGVTLYAFLTPVLVLENVRISFGLNRAWALGKARFWTLLGLLVVVFLMTFLIGLAFQTVVGLVLAQALKNASDITVDLVNTLAMTLINIFLLPLMPIAMTLLYYDTRVRLEGLDTALLTANKPGARPSDIESPLPQPGLSSTDWRNLIIVTVVTLIFALLASTLLAGLVNSLLPGLSSAA